MFLYSKGKVVQLIVYRIISDIWKLYMVEGVIVKYKKEFK